MMVPRGYLGRPAVPGTRDQHDRAKNLRSSTRPSGKAGEPKECASQPPATSKTTLDSSNAASPPVRIPLRPSEIIAPSIGPILSIPKSGQSAPPPVGPRDVPRSQPLIRDSAQNFLAATVIPPRRRPRTRKIQRLPDCDHVADFSKLLLQDIRKSDDEAMVGSLANPQLGGLFGYLNEVLETSNVVASSGATGSLLSVRSVSSDSMPSLEFAADSPSTSYNDAGSPPPSSRRSTPDRRLRQLSSSEDCSDDHPLIHRTLPAMDIEYPRTDALDISPVRSARLPKIRSVFRSNLTASLRAVKSAAQSVVVLSSTPPLLQPDDFLTRSIFSFHPKSTDDKRPPPSEDPPSPALRRYLNPSPTPPDPHSPADLHFWQEYPSTKSQRSGKRRTRDKGGGSQTPAAIQLQTCIPSPIRYANASSPPIWLSPDGTPAVAATNGISFSAGPNLVRQRELRENSAFLRILVAEMNMRRSGKFDDTMESHAFVWLPARKTSDTPPLVRKDRWELLTPE